MLEQSPEPEAHDKLLDNNPDRKMEFHDKNLFLNLGAVSKNSTPGNFTYIWNNGDGVSKNANSF